MWDISHRSQKYKTHLFNPVLDVRTRVKVSKTEKHACIEGYEVSEGCTSKLWYHKIYGTNYKSSHCIPIDLLDRLPAILDDNKVQVDLPKPPIGEGRSYQVDRKEIRSNFLWSIESGWTVPLCENKGNSRSRVHLSIPLNIDTGKSFHLNIPA